MTYIDKNNNFDLKKMFNWISKSVSRNDTISIVFRIPLILLISSSPLFSFAGGMEFLGDDTNAQGPAYFGFVKDEQGNILKAASVIVTAKSFGAAGVTATFTTNVLGLYRGHIHQEAQTEILKLSCIKEGYRQTRTIRKSKTNKFMETDCIMQKL